MLASVLGVACTSLLATTALAHGHVRDWTIAGKRYVTIEPYDDPNFTVPPKGIGRFLGNGINPMKDPLSTAMTCNVGSYPAPKMANVTAGSTIMARWNEWPHRGPVYSYMAACPNGRDCSDFNGTTGAHWFKIEETGVIEKYYPNNPSAPNAWATQKLFDADNTWNITIPACLKPGPYLIRHETMAIQDASQLGGAQFYPQCAQFWVSAASGSGQVKYLQPKLVSIPGDIQPKDAGVLFDTKQKLGSWVYTPP